MLKFFFGHDGDKRKSADASQNPSMGYSYKEDFREPVRTMSDFGGVIVLSPKHVLNQ